LNRDSSPQKNSQNLVTSGGVYTALDDAVKNLTSSIGNIVSDELSGKMDKLQPLLDDDLNKQLGVLAYPYSDKLFGNAMEAWPLLVENTPSNSSKQLVSSGGVYAALADKQPKINANTGSGLVLTPPTSAGGQPGTRYIASVVSNYMNNVLPCVYSDSDFPIFSWQSAGTYIVSIENKEENFIDVDILVGGLGDCMGGGVFCLIIKNNTANDLTYINNYNYTGYVTYHIANNIIGVGATQLVLCIYKPWDEGWLIPIIPFAEVGI
jgi:hypothetical protein